MPWRHPQTADFTRLAIVATVPSEPGVYALYESETCVFVGEAWNLKARLLEIFNLVDERHALTIRYETCPEDQTGARKESVETGLNMNMSTQGPPLPGIRLREELLRRSAS